jgi:hypothetical protein
MLGPREAWLYDVFFEVRMCESKNHPGLKARVWLELPESPASRIHRFIVINVRPDQSEITLQVWDNRGESMGQLDLITFDKT